MPYSLLQGYCPPQLTQIMLYASVFKFSCCPQSGLHLIFWQEWWSFLIQSTYLSIVTLQTTKGIIPFSSHHILEIIFAFHIQ